MSNVIQLPNREDGNNQNTGTSRRAFDFTFYIGVFLAMVLPQTFLSIYFGLFVAGLLALSTLVAGALGLGMYFNAPVRVHSCGPTVLSAESDADVTLKLAA